MDCYMYQAALYCAECGEKIREELRASGKAPADPEDEYSYDSGDYPKGPIADGGGESDGAQHCDACDVHLENPLTSDGAASVAEAIADAVHTALASGKPASLNDSIAWSVWRPFYNVPVQIKIGDPDLDVEIDVCDIVTEASDA